MTQGQLDYINALDYLTRAEVRDLMQGFTDADVLLDAQDMEHYLTLSNKELTQCTKNY